MVVPAAGRVVGVDSKSGWIPVLLWMCQESPCCRNRPHTAVHKQMIVVVNVVKCV